MTALTLTAGLRDWGYHVRAEGTAAAPPPTTSATHWTYSFPGWARFTVATAAGDLLVWIGQRERRLRGTGDVDNDPWSTEVVLSGLGLDSLTVADGHAADVRLDLGDDGAVAVTLDGTLAVSATATDVDFGAAGWVHVEGCAGYRVYQELIIAYGQWAVLDYQAADYFAADLGVTWRGQALTVEPADHDRHHECHNAYHYDGYTCPRAAGVWAQGDVPAMPKRQVVLLAAASGSGSAAQFARLRCGSEAVLQAVAPLAAPTLVGRDGTTLTAWFNGQPLDGWLAGLDYDLASGSPDPAAFATVNLGGGASDAWPLASPLGVPDDLRPAAAAPTALVALRNHPDAPWRTVREQTLAQPLLLAGPVSDDLALGAAPLACSRDLGATWEAARPPDLPPGVALWPTAGLSLCGGQAWPDGFALALDSRLRVLDLAGEVVGVGSGAGAPVLGRSPTGEPWVVLLSGGRVREWRGTLDGGTWQAVRDQALGASADLETACAWQADDGSRGLVGWHARDRCVYVFANACLAAAWHGPYLAAPANSPAAPYLCHRPTGGWEVGWHDDDGWTVYRAASLDGAWSLT